MSKKGNFQWKKIQSSGLCPQPRLGHALCQISPALFAIYGGYSYQHYKTPSVFYGDLWIYNATLKEWKQIKMNGNIPEPRSGASLHYDSVKMRFILFGGRSFNNISFSEVYQFSFVTRLWSKVHPIVYNEEKELYNFPQKQCYVYNLKKTPCKRIYHSSAFKYPYIVIFGGKRILTKQECLKKQEDKKIQKQENQKIMSEVFDCQSAACCDQNKKIFKFSLNIGKKQQEINLTQEESVQILNDLWVYDIEKNIWSEIEAFTESGDAPQKRAYHTSCFLSNTLYIIGGCNKNKKQLSSQLPLYELDLSQLTHTNIQKKQKYQYKRLKIPSTPQFPHQKQIQLVNRWGGCSTACQKTNRIYFYGGGILCKKGKQSHSLLQIDVKSHKFQEVNTKKYVKGGTLWATIVKLNDLVYVFGGGISKNQVSNQLQIVNGQKKTEQQFYAKKKIPYSKL